MGTTREFLVGLVFFGLLLLLGVFTILLTDVRLGPEPPSMLITFVDVEGLESGDEVWINGFKSGKVADVHPDLESNLIQVKVFFDREPVLYGNANFMVKPASPLGGRILAIDRGDPKKAVALGRPRLLDLEGTHRGEATADVLTEAAQLIRENREAARSLIANLDTFTGDLAKRGPETMDRALDTLGAIQSVVQGIERGEGTMGRLLKDEDIANRLEDIVARLDRISLDITEGKGALGAAVADEGLRDLVKSSFEEFHRFTSSLNSGEGTLAKLVHDPRLYDEAVGILTDVRGVTGELASDRGVGRIFVGESAWSDLESSLASLDAILAKSREAAEDADTPIGALMNDRVLVPSLRRSITSLGDLLQDTRENAPIATFAGFLFSAF